MKLKKDDIREYLNLITYKEMLRRCKTDTEIVRKYNISRYQLWKFKNTHGLIRKKRCQDESV